MIYSEPLLSQFSYFFYSLGFGIFIDGWYVLVIFIRMCLSDTKRGIIIADVIFSISTTVASFFFMVLYNNGQVRLNLVAGQFIGATVTHFLLGGKILKYAEKFTPAINKAVQFLFIPFASFKKVILLAMGKIRKLSKVKFKKSDKKGIKKLKKFNIIAKMHLKNKNKSV